MDKETSEVRPGQEVKVALERIGSVAAELKGATGVVYDGAFRGTHMAELMGDHGLLPVVPVQAKAGGRRTRKTRVERSVQGESGYAWIRPTRTAPGVSTAARTSGRDR